MNNGLFFFFFAIDSSIGKYTSFIPDFSQIKQLRSPAHSKAENRSCCEQCPKLSGHPLSPMGGSSFTDMPLCPTTERPALQGVS